MATRLKLNDIGLLGKPVVQRLAAPSHSDNTLTDRHDDNHAAINGDVDVAVPDLITGRSFDERRHSLGKHDPSRSSIRRAWVSGLTSGRFGKPLKRIAGVLKRYTAFCIGIFVGAILAQAPTLLFEFLRLMWAFATNPTPLRVAIIAGEILLLWMVGKWIASRRARAV